MPRVALVLGLFFLSNACGRHSPTALDRCYEGIGLAQLLSSVGVPPQESGWGAGGAEEVSENRIFDTVHEAASLRISSPSFTAHLCDALRSQLAPRCNVARSWAGADYCAFETHSSTTVGGVYVKRPSQGRLNLFAEALPDGTTRFVLTATEWPE
jgi:hypothetical protein